MGVQGKGTRFSGRSFFSRPFFSRSFFGGSWGKGRSGSKLRASAKAAVPLISVFTLGACALHPHQQDVTGLPTVNIVNHIRCETRVAIQKKAIDLLRYRHRDTKLAAKLEQIVGEVWNVNPYTELTPAERVFYFHYIQTGIAFNFTFDITEDNKAALMADPVRLITNGTAGIGLNSSGEFSREAIRTFIVSETFARLLEEKILGCGQSPLQNENFAYPVAGSIGMAELISTFIDLNENDPLTASSGGSGTKGTSSGSGVFADTLNFNTILIGGVTPSVQINPVGHKWGLSSPTNFSATVTRTDKHTLAIGLSLATTADKTRQVVATNPIVVTSGSQVRSALQRRGIQSPAEQRALDAVTQQRIDNFLNRFGTPVPTQ
jgi:hypothetical protein